MRISIFRILLIGVLAFLAITVAAPSAWSVNPQQDVPQVGTPPVYDGGKRAKIRGYMFPGNIWWKGSSRSRRYPGTSRTSPTVEPRIYWNETD